MGIKQLCLVPSDAEDVPADLRALLASLREIGFMAEAFEFYDETHYSPGADFLRLVHFYDSHPIIRLKQVNGELVEDEIIDSRNACSISFAEVTLAPEFLGGACSIAPLCPKCGYSEEAWPDMLSAWYPQKSEHRWVCPNCQVSQRVYDLDWQHAAALGRFRIIIDRIAYGEAVPTGDLLDSLQRTSGFLWDYYYNDDNPANERW
ncbi:MAG: hypothetical protein HY914_11170 [Desulfomonile tiedjei]|nr:hypothetical protein [Desulfomonile tiedjei]